MSTHYKKNLSNKPRLCLILIDFYFINIGKPHIINDNIKGKNKIRKIDWHMILYYEIPYWGWMVDAIELWWTIFESKAITGMINGPWHWVNKEVAKAYG